MRILLIVILVFVSLNIWAGEEISFQTKDGRDFKNVAVKKIQASGITVTGDDGVIAKIPLNLLPDKLREKYEQMALELSTSLNDKLALTKQNYEQVKTLAKDAGGDPQKLKECLSGYGKIIEQLILLQAQANEKNQELVLQNQALEKSNAEAKAKQEDLTPTPVVAAPARDIKQELLNARQRLINDFQSININGGKLNATTVIAPELTDKIQSFANGTDTEPENFAHEYLLRYFNGWDADRAKVEADYRKIIEIKRQM